MTNNTNKESMVIYESAYKAIQYLPDNSMKWEAISGLMDYGFYGVIPESDNPFINMVYVQAIPSMRNAKERYEAAVNNGKKGGHPAEVSTEDIMAMKQNGMTNREVAAQLGCSVKNIEKRVTTYNKTYPTNPTNLSVSVSVSDSVSFSVSDTDSVSSSVSMSDDTREEREIANANRKKREEDLTIEDIEAINKDYRNRMTYKEIQEKYNLGFNIGDFIKNGIKEKYAELIEAREQENKNKINSNEYAEIAKYFMVDKICVAERCKSLGVSTDEMYTFVVNNPQHSLENYKRAFPNGKNYKQYLLDSMKAV